MATETLEAATLAELDRLATDGPTDLDLERVRNLHSAHVAGAHERISERADRLSMYTCLFDEPERINTEISRWEAVDAGRVAEALRDSIRRGQPRGADVRAGRGGIVIARPIAGAPRAYRFPDFEHQRLANGLGVWLVPLPDRELVSIHLLTDAGAASEDEAQAGVAALTAQLLVTGTRRLDAAAFAETTERLGIEVGSESSWDSARAGFTALGRHLDAGLTLLAEMIRTPRLDPREFDRLKAERLNDILQARADAGRLADESFLREVFAEGVPYGRLSAGTPESVETLTVEDAARLPRHAIRAERGRRRDRRRHRSRRDPRGRRAPPGRLGGHGTGASHGRAGPARRPARRAGRPPRLGPERAARRPPRASTAPTRATSRPWSWRRSSAASSAAASTCACARSWATRTARALPSTRGARSAPSPPPRAVQTEVTVDAIRELIGQLERIREAAPTEDELAEVRDFLIGVFPLRFETTSGIAGAIEPLAVYDLPADWWHTYRDHLEAVGTAEVHAVARELIRPDEALILLAGDASQAARRARGGRSRPGPGRSPAA